MHKFKILYKNQYPAEFEFIEASYFDWCESNLTFYKVVFERSMPILAIKSDNVYRIELVQEDIDGTLATRQLRS